MIWVVKGEDQEDRLGGGEKIQIVVDVTGKKVWNGGLCAVFVDGTLGLCVV